MSIQNGTMYYDKVLLNFEYGIVNKKSNFCITGYYWGKNNVNRNSREGKTYGELAQRMIDSCKKNMCNYFMAEIPEFAKPGGYQIAINYKTSFVLHTLDFIAPRAAINIDTDMIITKYPALFDAEGIDYWGYNWYVDPRIYKGVYPFNCYAPFILRTSGGIMAFANSVPAKRFIQQWKDLTDSMPGKAEDMTISVAFAANNEIAKLRCMWLPINYFLLPQLYEFNGYYNIAKKYQKFFPHLKFSGNKTSQKYTYSKVFKLTDSNIYIVHPEGLTTEEQAALQGASSNRVPDEYFVETGKKLRCLTNFGKLINIPRLYCDNTDQVKSFAQLNTCLDDLGYQKIEKTVPAMKNKSTFSIIEEHIKGSNGPLYVFVNCLDMVLYHKDYIVCEYNKNNFKSYLIYKLMERYNRSIIYISNCLNITDKKLDIVEQECNSTYGADFGCINGNGQKYPVYKKTFIEACYDIRSLEAMTTDVLYFRNNKYGKNLLKLWNHCHKNNLDDRYSLSIAFNKYCCIIFMRVSWMSPSLYYPMKQKIFKVNIDPIMLFDSSIVTQNVNLYDYFKQCGNKAKLSSKLHITFKKTHLEPSRYSEE